MSRPQGFRNPVVYQAPVRGTDNVVIVAIQETAGLLIECKTLLDGQVGIEKNSVNSLVAVTAFYQKKHPNIVFQRIAAANYCFSERTIALARDSYVELLDQAKLIELLKMTPVLRVDIEGLSAKSENQGF